MATIGITTSAYAADQVVTNNNDSDAGSLRQAIADVHDGGTITFDDDYTITLQSSLPIITKEITIIGRGCKQTIIDGGGTYRAFDIRSSGTLTLKHLTVRNGTNIANSYGNLTLDGVDLHGNTGYAGAVQQGGSGASLTIINSAIYGNTATSRGGALHCTAGTVIVKNSTIYDNTSEYYGGGVCVEGGTMTFDSCTIAHNKFSGNYGSSKGGGIILIDGTLVIQNTIVANNQQDNGDNDYDYSGGTLTDNGYNFVEVSSTSDSTGFANGVNNNIVGTDPTGLASTLTYEGGWTPILKVTAGTFTGGNYGSTSETRDQRGYHRKTTEITRGAYQYDGIVARIGTDAWDDGYATIAGAVAAASDNDTIYLIDTVIKEVGINISSTNKTYMIDGAGTDSTYIWGADEANVATSGIFHIINSNVILRSMTIQYGKAASHGGAVYLDSGSLYLLVCVVADNVGGEAAGGVYNKVNSEATILNCTFRNNTANSSFDGGGVYTEGFLQVNDTTFTGNQSKSGGAIYIKAGATAHISSSTFNDNTALAGTGGGIANGAATVLMKNCTIAENEAAGGAGAGYSNDGGDASLANCTITRNEATGAASSGGGGIRTSGLGSTGLINTIVVNNTAPNGRNDIAVDGMDAVVTAQHCWYIDADPVMTPATSSNITTAYTSSDLFGLADNGGFTKTIAVKPTAPAVGAGAFVYGNPTYGNYCQGSDGNYLDAAGSVITPSDPANDKFTTDQRGITRVEPCTIGAYHQTSPLPIVTTAYVSNIDSDSADCGGNVTSEGSSSVTARGVCWDTSENPTTNDDKTTDGDGTGTFSSSITGLDPATTYYLRAYATNTSGTAYGRQMEFTTEATTPTLTTEPATKITETTAGCGGAITDEGGRSVTQYGVCWNTTGNPSTGDATTVHDMNDKSLGAPDKKGDFTFLDTLTGLAQGTTYYYRTYAINKVGTGYGPEQSFKTLGTATAPDLRVTVQASKETTRVGEEVGFNVDVQNVGTGSATGVALRLPLPQGTEFVGIYPAADQTSRAAPLEATVNNGIIEVQLGDVIASQLLKLELVLKAITAGAVTLEAAASCTESTTPATAQVQKDVAVDDAYLVITHSAFNACGMLGIMSPLLSIAGMLAMRRRRPRIH